ncbi:hypothetical protein AAG747_07740 [Rapidithrix thailandica]|uniref:Uncharacterized protein n=1 Tax=Rapidithrix thailandica TaxID=413964 RepID=A0AAW9RXR9_9BACT
MLVIPIRIVEKYNQTDIFISETQDHQKALQTYAKVQDNTLLREVIGEVKLLKAYIIHNESDASFLPTLNVIPGLILSQEVVMRTAVRNKRFRECHFIGNDQTHIAIARCSLDENRNFKMEKIFFTGETFFLNSSLRIDHQEILQIIKEWEFIDEDTFQKLKKLHLSNSQVKVLFNFIQKSIKK